MTRRHFVHNVAVPIALAAASRDVQAEEPRSKMGIATTSYMTARRFRDTYEFLEHCSVLGAGGIQSQISGDLPKIRARAEELGMFVEAIVGMPRGEDTAAFEKAVQNAKEVGALCVRVNAGGRRYEDYSTLADYEAFAERSHAALHRAVPICEKAKIPFALENHKDWTLDQLVGAMKSYSSEYLGVCLDFGNNIALLDDPMQVAEQLAPYTVTTHVKDMGVEPYPEGFLLSELPLGQGFLDLPKMCSLVKQARPKANLVLEMITRDPLKIPCLTDRYWATFPKRSGLYLARTIRLVHQNAGDKPLPRVAQLPHDRQVRIEEQDVRECMRYAREKLGC